MASGLCRGFCGVCEGYGKEGSVREAGLARDRETRARENTAPEHGSRNHGPRNGTTTTSGDAPEPGRSLQGGLLARRAGVHVDFHTNRDFNDLRCFPGHFDFSNVTARVPNEPKAMSAVRMAQACVLSPLEDTEARNRS